MVYCTEYGTVYGNQAFFQNLRRMARYIWWCQQPGSSNTRLHGFTNDMTA
jgi:hypothetical protein